MQPYILPIIASAIIGIIITVFSFIIKRLINELDKAKEEIVKLKEDRHQDQLLAVKSSTNIDEIKQCLERIKDKIYDE